MIAADFDYLITIRAADIRSHRAVFREKILSPSHVASRSTFVVMETIVELGDNAAFDQAASCARLAVGSEVVAADRGWTNSRSKGSKALIGGGDGGKITQLAI